jgi:hypothetical protein
MALTGCSLGVASNNNQGLTNTEAFHRGLEFFPTGKTLYWLGPKAAGFRLTRAFEPTSPADTGVSLSYIRDDVIVTVTTFLEPIAPPADTVYPTSGVLIGTAMTGSRQLVGLKITRETTRPSAATIAKLEAALKPVTGAEIDALPADWTTIP